jgi:hypothetical protein
VVMSFLKWLLAREVESFVNLRQIDCDLELFWPKFPEGLS